MLLVKTKVGPSPIAGIGLFADEDIAAGTVTWRFMPDFDRTFARDDVEKLPEGVREQFLSYAYLHQPTGLLVYCLDNARFMNHADNPNTQGVHDGGELAGHDVAMRDIKQGEELTCDYRSFDALSDRKLNTLA